MSINVSVRKCSPNLLHTASVHAEIRVSNTGTEDGDFTTVFVGILPNEDGAHEFAFPPVEARYVQLVVLNNWGNPAYTYVEGFQVWTRDREGGIVSLPEGPPASVADASSWSGSYVPENILDENANTYWSTPSGAVENEWVKVELGGAKSYTIHSVRLKSSYTNYGVDDFEIRVSTTTDEDSAFTTVYAGTAAENTDLQEFSFDPVEAKYVQLFINSNRFYLW